MKRHRNVYSQCVMHIHIFANALFAIISLRRLVSKNLLSTSSNLIKMPKKAKKILILLSIEKEKLEERIQRLLREKEVLDKKLKKAKLEKLVVDLMQEKEELTERIESLEKEKEDITSHRKAVEIVGDLKCPKDFQCYKSKYKALCKAGVNGNPDILHCLEEEPNECIFSLSYRDTYYCQCPLRNYIAEKFGK